MAKEPFDVVDRDKLDYRAGYVEGIGVVMQCITVMAVRAKPKEAAGLQLAFNRAKAIREDMIAKMREGK